MKKLAIRKNKTLIISVLIFYFFCIRVQDLFSIETEFSPQYLIELSGTVLNEKYSGSKALLTISPRREYPYSKNPYQVIIRGYPKTNNRNTFFWNSDEADMQAYSNQITCKIKETIENLSGIHFFYLSPSLLKIKGFSTQRDKEVRKMAEKMALPTKIFAIAGELKLSINSSSVSGNVWIKGYDNIEHSFVLYHAFINGIKSFGLETYDEYRKKK